MAYASIPIIATASALANEVILLLLGSRWSLVAPIFQVLAIGGAISTVRFCNGWIFVSTGHTGRQAIWAIINRPVMIAAFVVGLHWGPIGVAWAYVAANALTLFPSFLFAIKDTLLQLGDVWASMWRPLLISVVIFGAGQAMHLILVHQHYLVRLGIGLLACGGVFIGSALLVPRVREDLTTLKRMITRDRSLQGEDHTPSPLSVPGGAS